MLGSPRIDFTVATVSGEESSEDNDNAQETRSEISESKTVAK